MKIVKSSIFSPLHHEIENRLKNRYHDQCMNNDNVINKLTNLATSQNINLINHEGNTPFQYAIISYDKLAINVLIKSSFLNINHINKQKLNALMLAADHHLFLVPIMNKESLLILNELIEKTNFNSFYKKKTIHYIFKIIDQLIYQLEEKNQPVSHLLTLFLSKLNYQLENDKVLFPLLKKQREQDYYYLSMKILNIMKLYQEKTSIEKIISNNTIIYDTMNDSILSKKKQKI